MVAHRLGDIRRTCDAGQLFIITFVVVVVAVFLSQLAGF